MVLNIIQIIFLFNKIFINLNLLVNHILLIDLNRNIYLLNLLIYILFFISYLYLYKNNKKYDNFSNHQKLIQSYFFITNN